MRLRRLPLPAGLLFAALAASGPASGQAPRTAAPAPAAAAPAPGAAAEDEVDPEAGTPRAAAPDERSGHFLIDAKAAFLFPAGSLSSGTSAGRVIGSGSAFGGALGLGISPFVSLELQGAYGRLGASEGCTGCSGWTVDLGLGLAYHLAQGIAFDPWISYGVGFRTIRVDLPAGRSVLSGATEASWQGLDVARIALGGSFHPLPGFGFGPYFEADVGTFTSRPAIASEGACAKAGLGATSPGHDGYSGSGPCDLGGSVHAFFQLGVRIALDPARWGGGGPAPAKAVGKR